MDDTTTEIARPRRHPAIHAVLGAYTYAEFVALALAFIPVMSVVTLQHGKDETPRARGRWLRRFGRATANLTPLWKFSVEGTPPADIDSRPYVVVANHMSMADPFLLSSLPWDMRWVAKEELFRAPLAGWLMKLGGDIALKRGSGDSVREMLEECRKALRGGLSIMLFPEGTRSKDGAVKAFKDGAFTLALEEQVPILPVAISGTRTCMPKGSPWLGDAKAIARVLNPIETKGRTLEDLPSIREQARTDIVHAVADLAPHTI